MGGGGGPSAEGVVRGSQMAKTSPLLLHYVGDEELQERIQDGEVHEVEQGYSASEPLHLLQEVDVETGEGDPRMGESGGSGLRVVSYTAEEVHALREAGVPLRGDLVEAELERARQKALPYGKRLEEGLIVDKLDAFHAQLSARQRRPGAGIGGLRGGRGPRPGGGAQAGPGEHLQSPRRVIQEAKPWPRRFTRPQLVQPQQRLEQIEEVGVARPTSARRDTGPIPDRVTPTVVDMQLLDVGEGEVATLATFQRGGAPGGSGRRRPATALPARGREQRPRSALNPLLLSPSESSPRRPVSASAAYWRPAPPKPSSRQLNFSLDSDAREARRGMAGSTVPQHTRPPRPASASVAQRASSSARDEEGEGADEQLGATKQKRVLSARVPPSNQFAVIPPSPRDQERRARRPASAGQRNHFPGNLKYFPSFAPETGGTAERRVYMGSDAHPRRLF